MIKHKYLSGGLMALVGLGTIVGSNNYTIGSLARMGPGLFPSCWASSCWPSAC